MTKQQLIEDNMNLVHAFISREYPSYLFDEDLTQCGMVGLCKAADTWDEEKGKFSMYAWICIRHEVLNEFRRRAKHKGILSLDYDVHDGDGKTTPFGELIVGEPDVCFVDYCDERLTPLQKQIVDELKKGLTPKEVAEVLGTTHQNVYQTQRKLRLLRDKYDD
jgi:RNA polymerase sporulation-specific sigma factor